MQKRNTQARRRAILDALSRLGEVKVELLAVEFETSEVTIRKDLRELENNGLLLRKFGGAVPMPDDASELSSELLSPRKKAIAKLAATLIRDHNRIVVDSGSTTAALLPEIKKRLGLVIMTNSLQVANMLTELESEPKVLMTGGTWDVHSHSFQGQMAEQMLRAYNFDQAFLGAAGLDLERGTTTFNELTQVSQVMAEVSNEVIVLAESEKLHRRIPNIELPWGSISTLVTDTLISEQDKQQIENRGVRVLCATVNGE